MITKPQLPPKAGYVEVEIDGVRQYKKLPELEQAEAKEGDIVELLVDLAYRTTLLELGVSI